MNTLPLRGLKNHGNVCYISSLLMALSSLRKFKNYVMDHRLNGLPNNRGCLLKEMYHLFNGLFNENEKSENLYSQLLTKMFTLTQGYWIRNEQGDAQETLLFLFDRLSNSLEQNMGQLDFAPNFIRYLADFRPNVELTYKCKKCTHLSSANTPNFVFLNTSTTTKDVYDCLYDFSKPSKTEGVCENCNQNNQRSSSERIDEFPEDVLALGFRLFDHSGVCIKFFLNSPFIIKFIY